MSHFRSFKWSLCTKLRLFKGARDFFGPLNGTSDSEGHFGAKKVIFHFDVKVRTQEKKVSDFPVPSRDDTYQTVPGILAGNNLITSGQREFG